MGGSIIAANSVNDASGLSQRAAAACKSFAGRLAYCPFSFNARSTVFPDTDVFKVGVEKGNALVLIDGKTVAPLFGKQSITVKKAPFTADFPLCDGFDFMGKIRNKLNK